MMISPTISMPITTSRPSVWMSPRSVSAAAGAGRLGGGRKPAVTDERGGRSPRRPVAVDAAGAQLGAERDQLGQVRDGLDLAQRGDADEPVRVEVVAEQQRVVPVWR